MSRPDSVLDPLAMARARRLLATPARRERAWPALTAAGFAAVGAIILATAMILGPVLKPHQPPAEGAEN
ncbi:MAG TPA: hypothetical protein VIO94_09780 [Phenylobacterium sp.]